MENKNDFDPVMLALNTVIVLHRLFPKETQILSVYVVCKILKNHITVEGVQKKLGLIEKRPVPKLMIHRFLTQLSFRHYISKVQFENFIGKKEPFYTCHPKDERNANRERKYREHKRERCQRYDKDPKKIYKCFEKEKIFGTYFYDSKITVTPSVVQYFKTKSQARTFRDYISSNLIVTLKGFGPVSLDEIRRDLGIPEKRVRKLKDLKSVTVIKELEGLQNGFGNNEFIENEWNSIKGFKGSKICLGNEYSYIGKRVLPIDISPEVPGIFNLPGSKKELSKGRIIDARLRTEPKCFGKTKTNHTENLRFHSYCNRQIRQQRLDTGKRIKRRQLNVC